MARAVARTAGNTQEDGAREVAFALQPPGAEALAVAGAPSSVSVWVDDDDAPPGVPRNVRAAPGAGSATLTWEAPAYTSGGRVDQYQYRQSRNGGITWHPGWIDVDGGPHATEVVVENLVAGTEYIFEMRAVSDAAGNGAVSAASTATPIADPRSGRRTVSRGSDMNVTCKQCGTGQSSRPGQVAMARRWFPAAVRGAAAVLLATGALLAASQSNAQTNALGDDLVRVGAGGGRRRHRPHSDAVASAGDRPHGAGGA